MTQLTIVTTPTNSGDGTPLATAFNYCNSNFNELYARFQVDPPASLIGTTGDVPGMYAVDSTYFYYCFDTYDGTSTIWGQVTQIGNITVSSISSGTSNVKIADVNGNATTSVTGVSNVVVVAATGQYVLGLVSATGNDQYFVGNFFGNITGNFVVPGSNTQVIFNTSGNADAVAGFTFDTAGPNLLTVLGTVSSQGNVQAGNLRTAGLVSATGNVTGGNLSGTNITGTLTTAAQNNITSVGTLSSLTVTANVAGGNLTTGGQISATGNIRTANYLFVSQDINVSGGVTATSYTGTSASLSGNITGANIRTGGLISATGNITGNFILGNGSQLTGLLTNTIQNGNSNVLVGSSAGNISINVNGIAPLAIFTPLGQTTTGFISATGTVTAGNVATGGTVSATGEVTGANLATNGTVSASGNITAGNVIFGTGIVSGSGNVTGGNIRTGGQVSATGNITGGNLSVGTGTIAVGNIINSNANGIGNIGSSTTFFNTVFAKATSAQYADLAENYLADADYAPGTVVIFGGEKEITVTVEAADERVAGVISTNPAYLMNSGESGLPVALRGKVPVRVVGPVTKGDSLVTSTTLGVAFSIGRERVYGQAVFAKSLESNNSDGEKVILAVIV